MMNSSAYDIDRRLGSRGPVRTARRGFTLVELLVVMVVIAILMSLTAAGVMAWMNSQGRSNTDAALKGIQQILSQHWDAVVTDARKERLWAYEDLPVKPPTGFPQALYIPTSNTALYPLTKDFADNDSERARVLLIKIRLMEAFPINFSPGADGKLGEVPNPTQDPYANPSSSTAGPFNPLSLIPPGKRRYRKAYQDMIWAKDTNLSRWKSTTQTGRESVESAVCLWAALSTAKQGINIQTELLKTYMKDVDGTGNSVFADHWGTPLRFYRFATQNADAVNKTDSMLFQLAPPAQVVVNALDPLDPTGKLLNWTVYGQTTVSTNPALYDSVIHKRTYVTNAGATVAQYAIPILASAGTDGKFGTPAVDRLTTTGTNTAGFPTYAGTAPYSDMSPQPAATLPATGGDEKDNMYSVKRP